LTLLETFLNKKVFIVFLVCNFAPTKMATDDLIYRISAVLLRLGIRSVTMDDLARELSISKKTLYATFGDKRTMIQGLVARHTEQDKISCQQQREVSENAIDEMFRVTSFVAERIKFANPTFFYDLKMKYPKAFQVMQDYKWNYILNVLIENVNNGVKEGLYVDDFDAEIISRVYLQNMDTIFGHEMFTELKKSPYELFLTIFHLHLRGIVTDRGLQILNKKLDDAKEG